MQALVLHSARTPPLRAGAVALPMISWEQGKAALRVMRSAHPHEAQRPSKYVTLIRVPADHPVAVAVGSLGLQSDNLDYHPLSGLPAESRELLDGWLNCWPSLPDLSHASLAYVVLLVLGAPLSRGYVAWTKQVEWIENGRSQARRRYRG